MSTPQELFLIHEAQRKAINDAYLQQDMRIEVRDKMIAVTELSYHKTLIQNGFRDNEFLIVDETAKAAAVTACDAQIAAIPVLDWAAYGLENPLAT